VESPRCTWFAIHLRVRPLVRSVDNGTSQSSGKVSRQGCQARIIVPPNPGILLLGLCCTVPVSSSFASSLVLLLLVVLGIYCCCCSSLSCSRNIVNGLDFFFGYPSWPCTIVPSYVGTLDLAKASMCLESRAVVSRIRHPNSQRGFEVGNTVFTGHLFGGVRRG
jgi:hypothetical protein